MTQYEKSLLIKFILWVLGLLVLLYCFFVFIFWSAGAKSRGANAQADQIAKQKAGITEIIKNYHLDRGVSSYTVVGKTNGQTKYVIYIPHSKRAVVYGEQDGRSETAVINLFKSQHANAKITGVNLGWVKKQAMWEIAYTTGNGNLGYQLYPFQTNSKNK
ncbi:MAG: hypothetical protein Q3960_01715 [Lactobacillus sp.]|nr:hypothetical protein [Lactobacillus sp.]